LIVREYPTCFLIVLMFSYLFCLHCHRAITELQLVIIIMHYKGTIFGGSKDSQGLTAHLSDTGWW
jgi:hypothetical protein